MSDDSRDMATLNDDAFVPVTEWEIIARICGAAAFASLIGFEREIRNKPATVRMHIMVGAGAATFVGVALLNTHKYQLGDVNRVAAGIASGVGFLGAGTIFKLNDRVAGLSTAAGIWVVAAIGYSTANGYWLVSGFTTMLILVVQFGMLFFLSPHFWRDLREKFTLQQLVDSNKKSDGDGQEEDAEPSDNGEEHQQQDHNEDIEASAEDHGPTFRHSRKE